MVGILRQVPFSKIRQIYLRWLSGCFFGAIKFLVTFAIFLDFCKQFLLNIFLLKLRQKFCSKVLLQFAILVEFVIFAIFAIFLFISDSSFNSFFVAKIAKTICYEIFATVFDPGHKWRATRWHQTKNVASIKCKVKLVPIVPLALSGKRGSSSSLMDSSANWVKELMLALVYNTINQLCRAIIH